MPKGNGTKIQFKDGQIIVPDDPIIPFIEGDGIGSDIWAASVRVIDAAVEKAFGGQKRIVWKEILAGGKAHKETG
ncbi:MAG: NADP-dependent isocitrate dehydrogenase, partial [Candidatus Methylomirabilales bacterium]